MLRDEIDRLVGRINGDLGRIGRPAISYLHSSYPREEMAALYRAADVMVVTPYRDGMNLVAKEYVACRYDDDGALVLSEFAGAADELRQAWLVNPYDINGMKAALLEAYQAEPEGPAAPDARDAPYRQAVRRRRLGHELPRRARQRASAARQAPQADPRPDAVTPGPHRRLDPRGARTPWGPARVGASSPRRPSGRLPVGCGSCVGSLPAWRSGSFGPWT